MIHPPFPFDILFNLVSYVNFIAKILYKNRYKTHMFFRSSMCSMHIFHLFFLIHIDKMHHFLDLCYFKF